jgi:Acetamidase/Formamidase family
VATREIRIDRGKTLLEEPGTGHNRWHPDIPPVLRCEPGDEVVLETRDAFDGQMGPDATLETVAAPNLDVVHPLTGPVFVNGAEPGDVLEVEILDVEPDRYGYTVQGLRCSTCSSPATSRSWFGSRGSGTASGCCCSSRRARGCEGCTRCSATRWVTARPR